MSIGEQYLSMLMTSELSVVDVYQEWAGPCKAMVNNFRRLKNELGDDLLRFSVVSIFIVYALQWDL